MQIANIFLKSKLTSKMNDHFYLSDGQIFFFYSFQCGRVLEKADAGGSTDGYILSKSNLKFCLKYFFKCACLMSQQFHFQERILIK